MFERLNPAILNLRTGADAIAALDEAGIERGVLLSEAYVFASPYAACQRSEIAALTRAENAYNVDAARRSGGRLKAFIGINPLAKGAADELSHWQGTGGVSGVKLHLANSGFDPNSAEHVAKLATVFAHAGAASMAIVIHLKKPPVEVASAVTRFIEMVLPHAAGVAVQIAHGGGEGGLDAETLQSLEAFAVAIESGAPGTRGLLFDLAAVIVDAKTSPDLTHRYASVMRSVGLRRFVMGSDWPSVHGPRDTQRLLEWQLPLAAEEWRTILVNRAPYLQS